MDEGTIVLVDLHAHFPMHLLVDEQQRTHEHARTWWRVNAHPGEVAVAHSVSELDSLLSRDAPILIHAIEGGFQIGDSSEEVRANVRTLADRGVAYVTVAHLASAGLPRAPRRFRSCRTGSTTGRSRKGAARG